MRVPWSEAMSNRDRYCPRTLSSREHVDTEDERRLNRGRRFHPMTFAEIGKEIGVTPKRAREIVNTALKKLNRPSRRNALIEFVQAYADAYPLGYHKTSSRLRTDDDDRATLILAAMSKERAPIAWRNHRWSW